MSQLPLLGDDLLEKTRRGPALESAAGAVLSSCGLYRYRLTRRWAEGPAVLFVMLNPSTADATADDPTIRRCIGFAKREGMPAIEVVNLFAFRATKPEDLVKACDPVGPANDHHIVEAAGGAGRIIAAWGKSVPRRFGTRPGVVCRLLTKSATSPIYCLGKPGEGPAARHPLYLRADAPLEELLAGGSSC